jgi:oligopeptide transport system substrate-binding protein
MSQLLTVIKDCRYRLILRTEESDNRPINSFRTYTSQAAQKLAIILHQIFKKPRKVQMNSLRQRTRLLLALTILLQCHCGKKQSEDHALHPKQPRAGGRLRLAAQSPSSLDPIRSQSYWESEIVLQLFDGLVRLDPSLNIVPAIAQDWSISPDGRVYQFDLRKGVRFHNGREVAAEDFVYSFSRLLDPKEESQDSHPYLRIRGASDLRQGKTSVVSGLRAIDQYHFQIILEHPYAPFLRLLALQPASVVPQEEFAPGKNFSQKPVGTGPFRLDSWASKSKIQLKANPDYFGGKPFLDELQIRTFAALSAKESYQEFLEGKLDLSFVPTERSLEAKNNPNWIYVSRPVLRFLYLGLNMNDPLMQNPDVRKAIYHAINKKEAVGQDLDYEVTHAILPFSLLGSKYSKQSDPYDPEVARQALKQLKLKRGKNVPLQLWHAYVSDSRTRLLSQISSELNAVGFDVELRLVSSMNELLTRIYSRQTQLFLLGEQIDFPDPDALFDRLFNSKSHGNPFGYHNPAVDRLLMEAQETLDDEQRARLYGEIEQMILADHAILPLACVKYSYVHSRRFRDLDVSVLGFQYLPFRQVWVQGE